MQVRNGLVKAGMIAAVMFFSAQSQAQKMQWVDLAQPGDWAGRDFATTIGAVPNYSLRDIALCAAHLEGAIATCWTNRPTGHPNVGADHSNFSGNPPRWCTYKLSPDVSLFTPQDGTAKDGSRTYICAAVIEK